MKKNHIIESFIIGIIIILISFFALFSSGLIKDSPKNDHNLVFQSLDANKDYDGTILVKEEYKLVSGELDEGHTIVPIFTGEQLDIGESDNYFSVKIMENDLDVTSLYTINYIYGKLKVNKIGLTIETSSFEKIYDGLHISDENYKIREGKLLESHQLEVEFIAKPINVGQYNNRIFYKVIDSNNTDVTKVYNIKVIEGIINILPCNITIKSESAEKLYDGTTLVKEEYSLIAGNLVDNDTLNVLFLNSITNVGSIDNNFTVSIYNRSGDNITSNYNITKELGTLTITPFNITIHSGSASKKYDGTPLMCSDYTLAKGKLFLDHKIVFKNIGERTNVGVTDNTFYCSIVDSSNNDCTSLYNIEKIYGQLEITPRRVVVNTKSDKKYYDGTPLENKNYTILSSDLINGHKEVVTPYVSITEPGIVDNDVNVTIIDSKGEDVTSNYDILKNLGTLEIVKRSLTIITGSASKEFDKLPLTNSEYEILPLENLLPNHNVIVKITGEQVLPGESFNTAVAVIQDAFKNDVTKFYNIIFEEGKLTVLDKDNIKIAKNPADSNQINPNVNTSKPDSNDFLYQITPAISGLYYLKRNSFINYNYNNWVNPNNLKDFTNDPINPLYFTSDALTNNGVRTLYMTIEKKNKDLPDIYPYFLQDFITNSNDYRINSNNDTIYSCNYSFYTYNTNKELKMSSFALEYEKQYLEYLKSIYLQIPQDTKMELLAIANENGIVQSSKSLIMDIANYISNAARYNSDFSPYPDDCDMAVYFLKNAKEGICQHFATSATMMYRAFGIPARYTIGYSQALNANVPNNIGIIGHAWVEVYIKNMGWIPIEVTGSGESGSGDAIDGVGGGYFTPGQNKITIKPIDLSKKYDGTPLNAKNELQGLHYLLSRGYTYKSTVSGSQSTYGTSYSNIDSFQLFDYLGRDVTKDFQITYKKGKLTVYREKLLIETPSVTKVYDGFLLGNKDWKMTGSLEEGHTIDQESLEFIEPFLNVNRIINTVKFEILDENGKKVTNEYYIIYNFGYLEITARDLVITTGSATKEYDGESLKCDSYTVTGLVEGVDKLTLKIIGEQFGIGFCENIFTDFNILNSFGKDASKNYDITIIYGKLEITI